MSQRDPPEALLDLSLSLLDAAIDILREHLTTDQQLQHQSRLMPGGTPGKHFRHVIETFQAFLQNDQEINYDATLPKTRKALARNVQACRKAMETVRDDLAAWGQGASHRSESGSRAGFGVAGQTREDDFSGEMSREVRVVALTPTRQEMKSTVGRELWFCSLHAIHHFSMLRTIAVHELGLDLPVEFGTAPSTLLLRGENFKPPTEEPEKRDLAKL